MYRRIWRIHNRNRNPKIRCHLKKNFRQTHHTDKCFYPALNLYFRNFYYSARIILNEHRNFKSYVVAWIVSWICVRVVYLCSLSEFVYCSLCLSSKFKRMAPEEIRVITKLPNSEQSYKGKVKTHNDINRQNQSTTGKLWKP